MSLISHYERRERYADTLWHYLYFDGEMAGRTRQSRLNGETVRYEENGKMLQRWVTHEEIVRAEWSKQMAAWDAAHPLEETP